MPRDRRMSWYEVQSVKVSVMAMVFGVVGK